MAILRKIVYLALAFLSATVFANAMPESKSDACFNDGDEKACFEYGLAKYKAAKNTDVLIMAAQGILTKSCERGYLDSCKVLAERSLAEYIGYKENGPVFQPIGSCRKMNTITLCGGFGKSVNMVNRTLDRAILNNQLACEQGDAQACRVLPWLKKEPENLALE